MASNSPPPDDGKALVRAARNGEADAFNRLVEFYQPTVKSHVVRLLNQYNCSHLIAGHLDEIVQQIWTELAGQLHKFPDDQFGPWFGFLRRWKTLDYVRKELRYRQRHILSEDLPEVGPGRGPGQQADPEEMATSSEVRLRIRMSIRTFPYKYQAFINMYYFQGWTYRQIAEHMGIQIGSVGSLHTRAIRMLRKHMKKNKEPLF